MIVPIITEQSLCENPIPDLKSSGLCIEVLAAKKVLFNINNDKIIFLKFILLYSLLKCMIIIQNNFPTK